MIDMVHTIADRVAQREYQNSLALGHSLIEALTAHHKTYVDVCQMLKNKP